MTRVLIVEDEAVIRMDLEERLAELGYVVAGTAETADEAVAAAGGSRPDLVLMDVRLAGDRDGVSAAAEIRERYDLPVVYLTAFGDDETLARAKATGPFGYLIKPCQDRELKAAVEVATVRHTSERRLRASEERYAATVRSIGDGVIAVDSAGRVTLVNPAAERLTGWTQAEAAGRPAAEVFTVVSGRTGDAVPDPAAAALARNESVPLPPESVLLARDGRRVPVEDVAAPIRLRDGAAPVGAVVTFRDVTGRVEAEERLRHTQKLESIGVLAGGIAHDFNNLLTPVLGYAELLGEYLPPGSPGAAMLDGMREAAERAAGLTRQLLAYAGKGRLFAAPVDLAALVRDMLPLLKVGAARRAEFVTDLPDGLPAVVADATQLRQVVMNLVGNAAEALPNGFGTVTVRAAFRPEPGGRGRVLLGVSDTGCGMTPEVMAKIFDPFFTTKFTGRGLGLAAVQGIVRGHGGTLDVRSTPGVGTTFEVALPASGLAPPKSGRVPRAAAPPRAGRVLVVDDDDGVRALTRRVLEAAGLTAVEAEDGRSALDNFGDRLEEFDAVLLDVTMPRLGGLEVLAELRRLRPGLPVVLMSGFSPEEVAEQCGHRPPGAVVQKPFSPDHLRAVVERVVRG